MGRPVWWLPAIVLSVLSGAGGIAPAWAGGSGHGGGVHGSGALAFRGAPLVHGVPPSVRGNRTKSGVVARRLAIGNHALRGGRDLADTLGPIGFWPLWSDYGAVPMVVPIGGGEGLAGPSVVSIAPDSASEQTASAAMPDYSYVRGCYAIPNGYHCDTQGGRGTAR
jgi:hypothetical protein